MRCPASHAHDGGETKWSAVESDGMGDEKKKISFVSGVPI
jgi:hypothetical protein